MDNQDILKKEKEILDEIKVEERKERNILDEERKILRQQKNILHKIARNFWLMSVLTVLIVAGAIGGGLYWQLIQSRVYIDKSTVSAPPIDLTAQIPGILTKVYVNEGDIVPANSAVALVGDQLIKTQVGGLIVKVNNNIGMTFNPGQPVVTMIQPTELRIVGQLDENKGLSDVRVGQRAKFYVDAFGSKKYYGTVDEISPVSNTSGVVFNISNSRQVNQFNIKIRFDINAYPELKDGMSAKIYIYKN